MLDSQDTKSEESRFTSSAINEQLYQKTENLSKFLRTCESKLSVEEHSEYQSRMRFHKKTDGMIVVNNRNIEWLKKSDKEFRSQNTRTNLYVILSFTFLSLVIFFSNTGASLSVCLMSGLILYWLMVLLEKQTLEHSFIAKSTSYEIYQKSLERDMEEFNVKGSFFPLGNLLEINSKIDDEQDSVLKEELDLKGQILFSRLMLDFMRKYSVLNEILISSEFFDVVKETNYQELKKFKNT